MTGECVLACKYCYAGCMKEIKPPNFSRVNTEFRRKIPSLFKFTDEIISFNNNEPTNFIFHGGEPFLINPENWKIVLNYFLEKNYPVIPHVQTNAILINEEIIQIIKKFRLKIGVSLDGPAQLHNLTRVFKDGRGSFNLTFEKLLKLKKAGIKFGCLVTLNKTNIEQCDLLYLFFKKNKIPFNIRPIFKPKYNMPEEFLITPGEYSKAFRRLFDLWFEDRENNIKLISDFETLIAQFIKPKEGIGNCPFYKNCARHFVYFDMNGDLWPCGDLYNEKTFHYGNIKKNSLKKIMQNRIVTELSDRWTKIESNECKVCPFKRWCYGGCPSVAFRYFNSYYAKDYYCEAYKEILSHVFNKLRETIPRSNSVEVKN